MSAELDPYRPPEAEHAPSDPGWELVWRVAVMGAVFGLVAVLVASGGEPSWLLSWPLIPLVTVIVERWRRRARADAS